MSAPLPPRRAERWVAEAGTADVATLDIPADAHHDRIFEISCRYVVAHRGGADAWHSLRIDVDGRQEWSRRLATENPGSTDSLDYRFRRLVPAGQPLRVTAKTGAHGVSRLELLIEADEELG
ncbi:hypothetical protein [Caldimonas brevitalea]|uniref:Uncharacterized protein n=1 Tax=Caldimonas brevitalea TaxID=413882 RepID=A0A0G3BMZ7_9BURK|nr:hypothetical protein [Caldimonas brevitalea]AKJ29353.1 hypothetical protein AAW51_2662 [Caldimonas brevitalea]